MNTFIVNEIPITTLPSGDTLSIRQYTMKSDVPGPTVYIQSSVHGAELQGNPVICEIMNYLENSNFKGTVHMVPLANPIATNNKSGTYTKGRFNSNTGDNWNRNYTDIISMPKNITGLDIDSFAKEHANSPLEVIKKSFKESLYEALTRYKEYSDDYGPNANKSHFLRLQTLASSADYVLDLHTASNSTRYVYCAKYSLSKALDLAFPHYLVIPHEFGKAMDEACFMPWVYLQRAFNKIGVGLEIPIESHTIELGSEEVISFGEAKKDAAHILHYLKKRGVLDASPDITRPSIKSCSIEDYKTYFAKSGGLYDFIVSPGDHVKKGAVLAKVLNFNFKNPTSSKDFVTELYAKNDCVIINICPSASIQEGMEIIQVMENINEH